MYWADKVVKELKKRKLSLEWVDDMKTPSGRIHVGALRGVIIHDLVYRVLKEAGTKVKYTYIIDNHDPMDSLPTYLNQKKYSQYMGMPLNKIPAPDGSQESYAEYFAQEFINVFKKIGVQPEILWAWDFYTSGRMDKAIKIALDNAEKIQDIYQKVSGSKKKEIGWYPFQPICEKCGKVGTTKATAWDGKKVTYECLPNLVSWAKGCGYRGKISPFSGTGKLPWKVEWPAVWSILRITIEGEGKDLASKGGARDVANTICREIFKTEPPYDIPYEHFLIGGRKMSTSMGWGASAREMIEILPPEILRFLMVKTRYSQTIDFTPEGMTIPNLFDEYDRYAKEFWQLGRKSDLGRIFELSQIDKPLKKPVFLPRFRSIATYIQMPNIDIQSQFKQEKGEKLTNEEEKILKQRMKYAQIWLENYAPKEFVYKISQTVPKTAKKLNLAQKKYLESVLQLMDVSRSARNKLKTWQPKDLEFELYQQIKKQKISSAKAFEAIYQSFIGKNSGPKAAWLLLAQNKKFVVKRLKEVIK